jgi:antitoxin VapB
MALNIRNAEAERLAEELAKLTGETKTEAVTQALRDRLARLHRERTQRHLADQLDEIALHCARLPVRDSRTPEEILGHDEHLDNELNSPKPTEKLIAALRRHREVLG